jgi:hypothetical protein
MTGRAQFGPERQPQAAPRALGHRDRLFPDEPERRSELLQLHSSLYLYLATLSSLVLLLLLVVYS